MVSKSKAILLTLFVPIILLAITACPGFIIEHVQVSFGASGNIIGASVTFSCFSPVSNDIITYQWSFGDGNTAEGQTVMHSYSSSGDFVVECRVVTTDSVLKFNKMITVLPAGCVLASHTCKLYSVNAFDSSSNEDKLFQIDPANGSQLDVVTMTLPGETINRGNALANDPITNALFGVLDITNCSRPLVIIDPDTGVATMVGDTGARLSALAFDRSGTLYAVSGRSLGGTGLANCTHPVRTLFEVDKTNGQLTELCTLPSTASTNRGEALAYNPNTDLLYFATGDTPTLHTIDDTSGPTCSLMNISLTGGALSAAGIRVRGLVYSPFTENFLAGTGDRLFSITPGGVDSLLGALVGGVENLRQMAFVRQ
jgi:hypothetical protein